MAEEQKSVSRTMAASREQGAAEQGGVDDLSARINEMRLLYTTTVEPPAANKQRGMGKARSIATRETPSDKFYTPPGIAEFMISMVDFQDNDIVLEPCRGGGAIFNLLPDHGLNLWCEIDKGRDFFNFTDDCVDIIITNPPFSKFKGFLKHCITLRPRVICLLFGIMNVTLPRINQLRDAGYTLTKVHNTWWDAVFGNMVVIMHFELNAEGEDVVTTYDYTQHTNKKA